ncbi:MAG: HYR domain-containing protein, partial [Bacteroidetes bacterium]|nr:HYR domain-containing protein [Bacteroidota bacterium]
MEKNLQFTHEQKMNAGKMFSVKLFFGIIIFLMIIVQQVTAQSVLYSVGNTSICYGDSATLAVNVDGGAEPYTVVYSDGTNSFTLTNYYSNDVSGDKPIRISPASNKTYSLVSVTFGGGISLDVSSATVSITVNPLPSAISVTTNPVRPVCPNVNFTISASATNGSTYELWNASNTSLIGSMPYTTNIGSSTNYYVKAVSSATPACTTSQAYTVSIDTTKPTISCPSNQNLNTNTSSCNATLPDYTSSVTVHDNCTADGSITKTQSPVSGTTLTGGHNSTQLVTITATDASGNSRSCSFTITVKDTEIPAISGTATTGSKNTDNSQCYYTVSGTEFDPTTVTDNCGILKRTYKINSGSEVGTNASTSLAGVQLSKGTNVILWKAYDINGNTNTWTFTITVVDNQKPLITNCPANQNLSMTNNLCTAQLPNYISTLGIIATDNCGSGSLNWTQLPSAGTILSGGNGSTQLITIIATDVSGKSDTCTFTITVRDVQKPTISCPSNISQNVGSGICGAVVNYSTPVGIDNCTGVSTDQILGLASGSTFPVGVTTNRFKVTDAAGNVDSCSFTVTITDNVLPTISCPGNITVSATSGSCGAIVNYSTPEGTDICPGATTIQTAGLASGSIFPVGVTTNRFRVTDASGNKDSCSFTVTVTDNEKPVILNCPSNISQANTPNQCSAIVTWTEPTATDNCTAAGSLVWTKSRTPGSVFPVGVTTVTYTVKDAANNVSDTCRFTVTVSDTTRPVIIGTPINVVKSNDLNLCTATVTWTEPTATDNCTASGNLVWTKSHTPGSAFPVGVTTVTYTAKDAANNISFPYSFTVSVNDNQKPVIVNCPSNISVPFTSGTCGAMVTWTEPTATDNCTATANLVWTKSHTPNSYFPKATTTVTYTVKDAANNTSNTCSFNVTVSGNEAPVARCKPQTLYLNASGLATLTANDVDNNSTDDCGIMSRTISKSLFNCSNIGTNTVVLSIKDSTNNTSTCDATVTVLDTIRPVISTSAVSSNVNTVTGYCYYTVLGSEFDPIVTDNCVGSVLSYTVTGSTTLSGTGTLAGKQLLKGANVISWNAVDASGNTSNVLTFTKTVIDNQAPTITGIGNKTRTTTNTANCGYVTIGNEFDVVANDNCGTGSLVMSYTINAGTPVVANTLNGVLFPVGSNDVVWTVSDGVNTRTTSFKVVVADDDAPVITQLPDIHISTSGSCGAVATWTEPTVSDNCMVTVFSQTYGPVSGSTFNVGNNVVEYWAKDAAGNIGWMVFHVIVSDLTPPVLTCPFTTISKSSDTNSCFYVVKGTEFNPTVMDDCPGTIIKNSYDSTSTLAGRPLMVGTHLITWTATDTSGNSSSCTMEIIVTDDQAPSFTPPTGHYDVYTDGGKCYYTVPDTYLDPHNLMDNCSAYSPTYVVTKNSVVVKTGSSTLSGWEVPKDNDNDYSIVWRFSDTHGHTIQSEPVTLRVRDNQAPSFNCHGNEIRTTIGSSCEYSVVGNEFDPSNFTDNCDNTFSISYKIDGGVAVVDTTLAGKVLAVGLHVIKWTVTDQSGNSSVCSFNVRIRDNELPIISPVTNQTRFAPVGICSYTAVGNEFDPNTVSDNCGLQTLVNNQNGNSTLANYEFPVGITVVVWTATDISGNSTIMQYLVTVKDTIPPAYDIAQTASKNTSPISCYYTTVGTEFDPQNITDNCTHSNYYVVNDYNNYTSLAYAQFPVGTTNVVWTVKDVYGNERKDTIAITVTDNTYPVIACPSTTYTRVVDQGHNYYTVGNNEFKPIATDNCTFTYTNNITGTLPLTGVQLTPGNHIIVWTAVDAHGNTTTCNVIVDVVTSLYPPITCVGDQSRNASGVCDFTVVGTGFNATSTSTAATLINDYNHTNTLNGAVFPYGTTFVTWTASQTVAGILYTNTCSFYVTVNDNESPVITPQADITVNNNSGCYATGVSLGTPTVSDNCGVNTYNNNAPTVYPIGVTNVTWWIQDIHGNTSTAIQKVTVRDTVPPTITCPGSFCREADDNEGDHYTVTGNEFKPDMWENCSNPTTYTNSYNGLNSLAGVNLPLGTTNITWTATDAAGNIASCLVSVVVSNTSNPPVTCHGNQSRNTDPTVCTYTVQGTEFDVSTTATPPPTLTYTNSFNGTSTLAGAVFPKGTTNVVWTVSDGTNNNICCSFNVYVYDNEKPVVSWPANLTLYVGTGSCTVAGVDVGVPTATDNCDAPSSISNSRTPNWTTFPLGITSVYWTAWDNNINNISYHTQTVNVVDTIRPIISCPSSRYYRQFNNSEENYYTVVGSEFTPPVNENCSLSSYINDLNGTGNLNGTHLSIGDHTIKWIATDVSGNKDSCNIYITVVDSLKPIIRCPDDLFQKTGINNCSYTIAGTSLDAQILNLSIIPGRTLTHNYTAAPYDTTLNGAVFPKDTITVTWTAKQTINGIEYTSTCSHVIGVADTVRPIIYPLPSDTIVNVDPGSCTKVMTLPTISTTDNCGVLAITNNAPSTFLMGNTNVRWQVVDSSGNTTVYNQKVTVNDNEPPIITGCPTSTLTAQASGGNCKAIVSWPPLIATDLCSGMLSFTSTHSPGTFFNIGTTHVTYTAIDKKNNTSTCTFDVVVSDQNPTISCISDTVRKTTSGLCSYKVYGNEFDPISFDDNCTVASLTYRFVNPITGLTVSGSNSMSGVTIPRGIIDQGPIPITWTVTDNNSNTASCTFNLSLLDREAPIIVVPENQVRFTDLHKNYYTAIGSELDTVTAHDNCGIVTYLANNIVLPNASLGGHQFPLGLNTIVWTARDDNSNESSSNFYLYILDNESPRFTDSAYNTTAYASAGSCGAYVNYIAPAYIDNVTSTSNLMVTINPPTAVSGSLFPIGVTTVTYTVQDSSFNSISYSFDVTVIDTVHPTITCPPGSPFERNTLPNLGNYYAQGTEFDPIAYLDNCSAYIINTETNFHTLSGAYFPIGTHDIIWTVSDSSGNTASCPITVIIKDVEPPHITTCPNTSIANENNDLGYCYYTVDGADHDPITFSDNSTLWKLTYSISGGVQDVGTDLTTTLAGAQIPVGTLLDTTTIVTWKLWDINGNIDSSCKVVFKVTDIEPPSINLVGTQTRFTDAGQPDYTAKIGDGWDPIINDNCAVEKLTYILDATTLVGTDFTTSIVGEHLTVGTHNVVWTVTDIHGLTNTGNYDIIVQDTTPPIAICNPITVYLNDLGNYTLTSANIDSIALGSNDPNGIQSLIVTPNYFNCIAVGSNTVNLTVTDTYGNISHCDAIVTVIDTIRPVANCQNITVQLDAFGDAQISSSQLDNGSYDNCEIQSIIASQTDFTCSDVGDKTVTLTVTDVNGNVSTCNAIVTVQDLLPPTAVCKNIDLYLDVNGLATITGTSIDNGSYDNCSNVNLAVSKSIFDCSNIGENTDTLRITDAGGNYSACTSIVTVMDTIRPLVICKNITILLDATGHATITAADINNSSSDNCAIATMIASKTNFDCTNVGSNTVTLTVTDVNGNVSNCDAIVTIEDIPPVAICKNATVHLNSLGQATITTTDVNNGSNDACGAVNLSINKSNFNCTNVGANPLTNTVTMTVTDVNNIQSSCPALVTVIDTVRPSAICQAVTVYLDGSGNASITAEQVDNGSNDACGIQSISVNPSTFTCSNRGSNTVTLTVTDVNGNINTCNTTVTVTDSIKPIASCKNITVQLSALGTASITGASINLGSTDNCGIASLTASPNSFNCSNIGSSFPVTLTVTDVAGNTSTCISTVTVGDTVKPNAICKNITIYLDATGNISIADSSINNGSNDACGIASIVASKKTFTCADKGANSVTLTVTDNNENISSCVSTVTVLDNLKPIYTLCPSNKIVSTDNGLCTYTHHDITWDATATDNCAVTSLTYNLTGVTSGTGTTLNNVVFNKGLTTVTWTASDASGNTQTCSYTVTVNDNENPVAICKAASVYLDINGQVIVQPSVINNNSTDNCGIVTYLVSKNDTTYSNTVSYNCSELSTHTIYLKVIDAAGNYHICSSMVTVLDTIAPVPTSLADKVVSTAINSCTYTNTNVIWNAIDNCDPNPTITFSLSGVTDNTGITDFTTLNGVVFNKGTTLVTWTTSDASGNHGISTFNVIVNDSINPTIECPGNLSQNVAIAGATSAFVPTIANPTYDDNCAVVKLTYALTGATSVSAQLSGINTINSGTFNLGTTTIKYIAYDAAGNTDTCTFKVTINALPDDAITVDTALIITYEDQTRGPATFKVVLPFKPTGTVCMNAKTTDTTEAKINTTNNRSGTVDSTMFCFNETNWNIPQTIYVFGIDDFIDDDTIPYTIVLTINENHTDIGSGYFFANPADVNGINIDNDTAGVIVSPISNHTTEAGGTATFTIVLKTEPVANVSFNLTSNDLTEGYIIGPSDSLVTFTPANWNIPQTVTVKGKDELFVDGNVAYTIITSNAISTDPKYSNMVADDVAAINDDNDIPGFIVSAISNHTTEGGGTATFTVRLTSQPATDLTNYVVLVNMVSNDTTEGSVTPIPLTFTAADWNINQTVTVHGIDDIIVDGNIPYTIVLTVDTAGTTDPIYKPLNPNDVNAINNDNDTARLAINNVRQLELNSGTSNFEFTVTHTGAEVPGGYTVTWYTQNSSPVSASFPSDYAGTGGTLSFTGAVGETKTIDIVVNGDTRVEPDETFRVVLSSVNSGGRSVLIPAIGKVGIGTILNDDGATFAINDVSITEGNSGTQLLNFTVTLSEDVESPNPITVDYVTSNGNAIAGEDYVNKTGTLSFTGSKNETKTISVTINGDTKVELNETFNVLLSNIQSVGLPDSILSSVTFLKATGIGTINNDDAATVSINSVTHNEGNSGTTSYDFTVTLSNPSDTITTVNYTTVDGTATTADLDYTANSGILTFAAGETTKTITVLVNGDTKVELNEAFTVALSGLVANGRNITLPVGTATGTGTITNDDAATLAIDNVSITEGNSGTSVLTFTVTHSGGSIDVPFSLDYATANGTAKTTDGDYVSKTGTLNFSGTSGETQTINVTINGDTKVELNEAFTVGLSNLLASGRNITIATGTGTGTILNDDAATVNINNVSQYETNTGTTNFNFTVSLTNASDTIVTVKYATANGTATTANNDYTAKSNQTLTFAAGETSKTVAIVVKGDLIVELDETFTVGLSTLVNNGRNISLGTVTGTGTILNDDSATVNITNTVIHDEGNSGNTMYIYTISLTQASDTNVLVNYATTDGTATTADNDYTLNSGTLTFAPGQTTKYDTVLVKGDTKVELNETYTVGLSNLVNNRRTITIGNATGTGTITNDDAAVISISGFTVNEAAGTATYTITMDKAVQTPFTIDFATANNTALAESDYTAISSTLTFGGANPLVQTVTVNIIDDNLVEPTETLFGIISNKLDAANQSVTFFGGGSSTQATGTITDNDVATIAINDVTVNEADGIATFTVTLTGNVQNNFTFNYSTADNTAVSASDYTAIGLTQLTFGGANSNIQTFNVPITNDNIAEAIENYKINLTNLNKNSQTGISFSDSLGIGTIIDNDTVHLVLHGFTVTETDGTQTQNFYVSQSIASQSAITLLFGTTDGTATSTSDYTSQSSVGVTLPASSTSNVNVSATTIAGDLIAEPTEAFTGTITLNNINGQNVVIDTSTATGTILDNDIITINLAGFTVTETEGTQTKNFVVSMNHSAQYDIVLTFSTANGTALAGNDFNALTDTVITIPAGVISVNIPVSILGDLVVEPQEAFTGSITLTNANNQQATVGTNTVTATINDNDHSSLAITGFTVNENAGTTTYTITQVGTVQNNLTVHFATSNITAYAGSDYTAVSQTLTFGSSNPLVQYVTIPIIDDNLVEPTETLLGTISNLDSNYQAVSIVKDTAIGTILDNDTARIAINDVIVKENEGPAVYTVTLTGNIQDALTLSYTTNDITALNPSDYTTTTGTVTFPAGSLSGATLPISVPIIDNSIAEPTEYYHVDLSNIVCTGASLFTDNQGLGTILDNDTVTTINLAGFTVTETNGTVSHNFVATMNIPAQDPVIISFTTTNGTAGASDFTAQNTVQYTILPGTTSINIPIDVLGDLVTELSESFTGTISLVNANGQQIYIGTATATGTINDDDAAIINVNNVSQVETNSGTTIFNFTVTLSNVSDAPVTVNYATSNGTATTADLDYIDTGGLLTFAPGETTKNVSVTVYGDTKLELDETFHLNLSNLDNNGRAITLGSNGLGTILNDDAATLAINNVAITEGNNGTSNLTFTVTHSGSTLDTPFTVDYSTADGTATTADLDYVFTSGTLNFSGTTSEVQTFNVPIIGDKKVELNEVFSAILNNIQAGGRNITIATGTGTGTIINDDHAPVVSDVLKTGTQNVTLPFASIDFTSKFSDVDSDTLVKIKVVSLPANGTLKLSGVNVTAGDVITFANLPNITFVPNTNWNGVTIFDWNASDGTNWAAINEQVIITINAVNIPPVAVNDVASTNENTAVSFPILTNDYDLDGSLANYTVDLDPSTSGQQLSYTVAGQGTFTVDLAGIVTFTPVLNYHGTTTPINYTVKDNSGATSNIATITVTVYSINHPPVIYNESISLCQGATITGNVLVNGDYDPDGTTLTVVTTLVSAPAYGTFTINAAGDYNYVSDANYYGTVKAIVSVCDNGTPGIACKNDTVLIVINQKVTANAGPSQFLCGTNNTFLIGNDPTPGTGYWTLVSGLGMPMTFPPSGSTAIAFNLITSNTPYIFKYTIVNANCSTNDTISIYNYMAPSAAYAGVDKQLCVSSGSTSTNMTASALSSGTGTWSQIIGPNSAVIANTSSETTLVSNLITGFYTFRWTSSNGVCLSNYDDVNITVNNQASVYAGADARICQTTASYVISDATASNALTLNWSTTGTGSFNNTTAIHPTYTPSAADITSGTVSLILTATSGNGCVNSVDTMNLIIEPKATANAGSTASICSSASSYIVSGATATNYSSLLWTASGTGILTNETTLTPTYTFGAGETGAVTLTLTAHKLGIVCSDAVSTTVLTIVPATTANAGTDTIICEGSTFTLSGSSASNYTSLLWSTCSNGCGNFSNPTSIHPIITPSASDILNGYVVLKLTANSGSVCSSVTSQMTLSISKQARVGAGNDATICQGSSYTLFGSTQANAASLKWTSNGDGIFTDSISLHPVYTPGNTDIASGTVSLILTGQSASPCFVAKDTMVLSIIKSPTAYAGTDTIICSGTSSVSLTGTSSLNATSYQWTTSGTGTFTNQYSLTNATYLPSASDKLSTQLQLTLMASNSCGIATDVKVLAISPKAAASAGPNASICFGNVFVMSGATAANYDSITWSSTGGTFNNVHSLNPTFTATTTGAITITLTATAYSGCQNAVSSMILNVTPLPILTSTIIANTTCNASV